MKKRFCFSIFFVFIILRGWSQQPLNEPSIYFEHFLFPGALYFNPINDIAQDSTGLMWFASDNGVYRYDGYEFINSHEREHLSHIRGSQAISVLPGKNNTIYAALKQKKGIIRFKNDFSEPVYYSDFLKTYDIHDLFYFQDHVGFLSKGRGLFLIDEVKKVILPLKNESPVFSICHADDKILAGSFSKILIYEDMQTVQIFELPQINDRISSLQQVGSDIYFSTQTEVYKFNIGSQLLEHVYSLANVEGLVINKVKKIKNGNIWILTDWDGLFVLDNNNTAYHFEKSHYVNGAISNNRAFSIYESRDGVIWVGTGAGMNKYDKNKRFFSHLSYNPVDKNSLSGDIVRGVFENSNEELFIGTDDGTLNIIDSARKHISHIPIEVPGFNKIVAFGFVELSKDKYYVGTTEGLFLFDAKNKNFIHLQSPHHPDDKRVRQLLDYDKDHILGLSRGLIWKLNKKTNKISTFNTSSDQKALLNRFARTIYINPNKSLYVGCLGTLAYFNPESGELLHRKIVSISSEGDTIRHMVMAIEKYDNKLYLGTFQGGLFILDLQQDKINGKLSHYNVESGLPDNTTYSALKDRDEYIWISTNNGISRFNPVTELFKNFDRSNGLQGEEFNRLAAIISKRGEFIFGGIEGLNIFFPEKLDTEPLRHIDPILLNVEVINQFDHEGSKSHPRYSLINRKNLTLDHNENYLTFRFAANNYSEPEKNNFYYKLDNYDKNWIYSKEKTATYTGLRPGKYNFKVKAISPDGKVSPNHASIPFEITSLWWTTWWIGLLVGMALIGIITYTFKKNVNKNNAIKKLLETEIERRTSELKESKEELARLNSKKDFIFSILSHDLRSPLTTLKGFLGILVDHFDSLNEEEIKTHAVNIKNSVAKSLDLLDNTLYWSLSQMGEITYTPSRVSLSVIFDKLYGLYDLTAKKKNVNLHIKLEEEIDVYADENMTYITLRNLLSNAIKFTPSGKNVYVYTEKSGDGLRIIVQDEGYGIRTENLSKLFDHSQQYMEKGTSNEKGTGLGLTLCKKFTDMNNGQISVESQENSGTRFIVTLPVYNEQKKPYIINPS